MKKKEWLLAVSAVCVWLAFSPELFLQVGMGCFQRADQSEMTVKETREIIEQLIYPQKDGEKIVLHTKSKLLELFWRKE